MTPRDILEQARSEHFTWVDYYADDTPFDAGAEERQDQRLDLRPAMSDEEIRALEERLPGKLPVEVRDLLCFASGFSLGAHEVSFHRYNMWGYDFLLPHVAVLDDDGAGNSWVIEINPEGADWRHVWFVCHDPPVLVYQCEILAEFIDGVLDLSRFEKCKHGHRSILYHIDDLCIKLWRGNKRFPKASSFRRTDDSTLAAFVATLDDAASIIDLRGAKTGDGFDWTALSAGGRLRRAGSELLFSIEPKKGFFRRLRGR